jgi:hypothetical protein
MPVEQSIRREEERAPADRWQKLRQRRQQHLVRWGEDGTVYLPVQHCQLVLQGQ